MKTKKTTLTIETLMPLIDLAHSEYTEVLRDASAVLATLSYNEDSRAMLVAAGALRPLLKLAASDDIAVQREAYTALARLCESKAICTRIAGIGSIEWLLAAMSGSGDEHVSRCAAQCVASMSAVSSLRKVIAVASSQNIHELIKL